MILILFQYIEEEMRPRGSHVAGGLPVGHPWPRLKAGVDLSADYERFLHITGLPNVFFS